MNTDGISDSELEDDNCSLESYDKHLLATANVNSILPPPQDADSAFTSPKKVQKRKRSNTPPNPMIEISNKFDLLSTNQDEDIMDDSTMTSVSTKPGRIPPIIISLGNSSWKEISSHLQTRLTSCYTGTLKSGRIHLKCTSIDDFRKATHELDNMKLEYHTFELPNEKLAKVVIRNLPADTNTDDILNELNALGYPTDSVTQLKSGQDKKKALPLFLVYTNKDTRKRLNNLQFLFHLKIELEQYKKRKGPGQCFRCQAFGHASKWCKNQPKCVKCGKDHMTYTCEKPRDLPATCANCKGDHPANFRGCPAHPSNRKTGPPKPKSTPSAPRTTQPAAKPVYKTTIPGYSYAKALSQTKTNPPQPINDSPSPNSPEVTVAPPASQTHVTEEEVNFSSVLNMFNTLAELFTKFMSANSTEQKIKIIIQGVSDFAKSININYAR